MGESEPIVGTRATAVAATSRRAVSRIPISGDISPRAWFVRLVDGVWTRRLAAKNLHFHTKAPERTCRDWSSGATEPAASVLVALLRSADGGRVLDFIMAGATAAWWRELRRARIVAGAYDAARASIEQQLELALD